jgi:dephospho-CoA kinase
VQLVTAMKIIGLTGGIGMGKSTAAAVFRRARLPVFDADAVVHQLQARHGRAVRAIAASFPEAVQDGAVDRAVLRAAVLGRPDALQRLESIIHPLVRDEERRFIALARRRGSRAVILDIPLLFETGAPRGLDAVIVVSAPRHVQEQRVRARRGMSAQDFAAILARQMPDAEKRRRADLVVRTGLSRAHALRPLRRLISRLVTCRARS